MSHVLPKLPAPNQAFATPATPERLRRVAEALERRGIHTTIAADATEAKQLALALIPEGAEVHIALSETMAKLGITPAIQESGKYDAIRPKLMRMDRATQHREMRKLATAPDYILGSVHAITDDGILLIASGSGSQLGPYAQSAGTVVLVAGHQKIVSDVTEGLRRIHEYSLPMEDQRMKDMGHQGSIVGKVLLIEHEMPGRIHLILIPEVIGF
ncbi:MAG TPA: LUD domain-containing protein [Ktedonobacterales bacterium]|nr:LUD domain-containing protein [Ktedonobacterales bacterium]